MARLQLTNVSLAFGDRDIFKDITLHLDEKSRVTLTGANGSGKSTLMKVMIGRQEIDSGSVIPQKKMTISYLPQWGMSYSGCSLAEEADKAFLPLQEAEERLRELESSLEQADDEQQQEILLEHHEIQERLLRTGYYDREREIYRVLEGLGFSTEDFGKDTSTFSGGWQMRISLAKILLESPDVALLDEPTNYLDLEARDWLIRFLESFGGGILVVSHDRHFLDAVGKEVAELFLGGLKIYKGNYTQYEKRRQEELETLIKRYEIQQQDIAKHEAFIRKFRYSANRASLVQSRIKMLEKMERIEIPEGLQRMKIRFPEPPHSGKDVVTLEDGGKAYGEKRVFSSLDFNVQRGTKLAVVGVNGAGKSTLLRILAGMDKNFDGSLRFGKDVSTGYFAQDVHEKLGEGQSVLEAVEETAPSGIDVRKMLGAFLFGGDDVYKDLSVLSGGERGRVALLRLLLRPLNLLILDEPTNHLDIHSKDALLDALRDYSGTVIFVSHDRYFIEQLADAVLEIDHGGGVYYPGDYAYFRYRKENPPVDSGSGSDAAERSVNKVEDPTDQIKSQSATPAEEQPAAKGPLVVSLSHQEQKRLRSEKKKWEKQRDEALENLEKAEFEKASLEQDLALPENYSDGEKAKSLTSQITDWEKKIHLYGKHWEEAEEALSQISS